MFYIALTMVGAAGIVAITIDYLFRRDIEKRVKAIEKRLG
jgi:hypothetical protein